MNKEEILDYVKGYYKTYRQTKNGLFIYSGGIAYTYISNEEIGDASSVDWVIYNLDVYKNDVERLGGGTFKKRYKIVQTNLLNITLASCDSLEFAQKYLEDIKENDKYLQKLFGWSKLPEYKIIEIEEEI